MTTWTTKPLGNVLRQIKTGSTPRTSHPEYFNGDIPWFTPSDIGKTKNLTKSSRTISEDGVNNGAAKLFSEGTVLVTCIGEVGRVGVLRQRSSANQQITALIFDETVLPDYAYYWFIANPHQLRRFANQAVVPILNNERLQEVPFSFPADKQEQTRIIAQLDESDSLVRTRRYALELSDTFLPAAFLELFGDPQTNPKGWDRGIIEDVVGFSQYGTSQKSNSARQGYPVLGMGNITNRGSIDLSTLAYVDLPEDEFEGLALQRGDIIFNRTNSAELVGKTACWNLNMNAVLASYLVRLQLKPEVLPEFFSALLNTGHFKNLFRDRCKKAVGQSNISPTLLKEFPAYIPPLPVQQKFAALVERVERLRAVQREALRQAEHLFDSLLHRAFSG